MQGDTRADLRGTCQPWREGHHEQGSKVGRAAHRCWPMASTDHMQQCDHQKLLGRTEATIALVSLFHRRTVRLREVKK